MRLAPRIAGQRGPDGLLGLRLDRVRDPELGGGERPAEDDEALVDEAVHEGRMRLPVGLLRERLVRA